MRRFQVFVASCDRESTQTQGLNSGLMLPLRTIHASQGLNGELKTPNWVTREMCVSFFFFKGGTILNFTVRLRLNIYY